MGMLIQRLTKKKGRPKEDDLGRYNPINKFAEDYLRANGLKVNKRQIDFYKKIINTHLKEVSKITLEPRGILLPNRLGHLRVIGYNSDFAVKDIFTSKKLGKDIYYNNAHTNGLNFKILLAPIYDPGHRKISGFKFDSCWKFVPNRCIRKALVTGLKDKTIDYKLYQLKITI